MRWQTIRTSGRRSFTSGRARWRLFIAYHPHSTPRRAQSGGGSAHTRHTHEHATQHHEQERQHTHTHTRARTHAHAHAHAHAQARFLFHSVGCYAQWTTYNLQRPVVFLPLQDLIVSKEELATALADLNNGAAVLVGCRSPPGTATSCLGPHCTVPGPGGLTPFQ